MTVDPRAPADQDEASLPDEERERHIDELRATIVRSAEIRIGNASPNFRHIAETLYDEHFGPLIEELDSAMEDVTTFANARAMRDAEMDRLEAAIASLEAERVLMEGVITQREEMIHGFQKEQEFQHDAAHEAETELYHLRRAVTRIAYAPEEGNGLQRRWKRKEWMRLAQRMRMVARDALAGVEAPIPGWGSQKGVLEREIERWREQKNPEVRHLTATYPTERQDRDR